MGQGAPCLVSAGRVLWGQVRSARFLRDVFYGARCGLPGFCGACFMKNRLFCAIRRIQSAVLRVLCLLWVSIALRGQSVMNNY